MWWYCSSKRNNGGKVDENSALFVFPASITVQKTKQDVEYNQINIKSQLLYAGRNLDPGQTGTSLYSNKENRAQK